MMHGNKPARRLQQVQQILDRTAAPPSHRNRILVLPDGSNVYQSDLGTTGLVSISIDADAAITYRVLDRTAKLVISALGTPFEGNNPVPSYPVLELHASEQGNRLVTSTSDIWATVYALWTIFHSQENIPVVFGPTVSNANAIASYFLRSGLAQEPLDSEENALFLLRGTFWQGAGVGPSWGNTSGWLRYAPDFYPFPLTQSFTRTSAVIAQHPLRPPKPPGGTVIYSRFCAEVGQVFTFHVIDPSDHDDVDAFHYWMNNERVNSGWGERGDIDKHRTYIARVMKDPAALPLIMSWDGERMGYCEIFWVKENHVAPYVPFGARDYDRGMHVLVGEDKFRGRIYSQLWFRIILHYVFLADPRTERIIGEPKSSNVVAIALGRDSGLHNETSFYFPYKHSSLEVGLRESLFKEDMLL